MNNHHGVDTFYFNDKLGQLLRDIDCFKPAELSRALARLAKVADEEVLKEVEFAATVAQEPVAWEYRTFHGDDTVTPGWSKWERIEPQGRYSHETVESRVEEIQSYIDRGYRYQLRALYTVPHDAEQQALRKAPPEWAKMDPVFVVECIRQTTVLDADMVEAMLQFAIDAARAAKEGA